MRSFPFLYTYLLYLLKSDIMKTKLILNRNKYKQRNASAEEQYGDEERYEE